MSVRTTCRGIVSASRKLGASATMAASSSVTDLPVDIVRCIADLTPTECRPRMRAACSALSAAVPAEPPPWILIQPGGDDGTATTEEGERSRGFSVLSLPADAKLSPGCSVVRGLAAFPASRCVGAGHGWVALVGADLAVTLHNPVSGGAVSLPPLSRHPLVGAAGLRDDGRVLWRTWLDLCPNSGDLVPAEEFRDDFVRKVVFSARPEQERYFAVVIGGFHKYAMYARAGAGAWETLRDERGSPVSLVHDAVHVEGGRFLAVTRVHGKVLEFDLTAGDHGVDGDGDEEEDRRHSPTVSFFAEPLGLAEWFAYSARDSSGLQLENHLVLIDGKVYQIWSALVVVPGEAMTHRHHIEEAGAVRFDPERSTCWTEVADLGDWAVLVGKNETVAVRAGDVPGGVRGSCVYYIDGKLDGVVRAFDLRSGRAEVLGGDVVREACSSAMAPPRSHPPVWFLPSLK